MKASTEKQLQHAINKHVTTWQFEHPGVVSGTEFKNLYAIIVLFARLMRCDVLLQVYVRMNFLG